MKSKLLKNRKYKEITIIDLEKAFKAGRLYEAGELELNTDGRETAFEVWFEDVFNKIIN
jgi:hypothetical protein